MPAGSTFFLTGAGDALGDIGGFFTGPPGDPQRIRHIASRVDALNAEYQGHVRVLSEAVDLLTTSWTGDAARSFHTAWYGPETCEARPTSPVQVMSRVASAMTTFAGQLRDYADSLERAQHEHWIELGVMAAMTLVNVAQLGADPVTDAAEIGIASGSAISFGGVAEIATTGAMANLAADVVGQLGADVWDGLDPGFDRSGGDGVPVFDVGEAVSSGLSGAVSGLVPLGVGQLGGGLGGLMGRPLARVVAGGVAASAADAGFQWATTGEVDWTEVAITGGLSGAWGLRGVTRSSWDECQVAVSPTIGLLAPNDRPIGLPGTSETIRVLPAGGLGRLWRQLIVGGTPETPLGYPGEGFRLPGGGWIGMRQVSKSGGPAIDVSVPGLLIKKIHEADGHLP